MAPPRKRMRYKRYNDADEDPDLLVPRQTVWSAENSSTSQHSSSKICFDDHADSESCSSYFSKGNESYSRPNGSSSEEDGSSNASRQYSSRRHEHHMKQHKGRRQSPPLAEHCAANQVHGGSDPDSSPSDSSDHGSDSSDQNNPSDTSHQDHLTEQNQAICQGDPDPNPDSSPSDSSEDGSDDSQEDNSSDTDQQDRFSEENQDNGQESSDDNQHEGEEPPPDQNIDESSHDGSDNSQEDNSSDTDQQDRFSEGNQDNGQESSDDNQHEGEDLPPAQNTLRDKLRGEYSARIEERVAASRGEVLLNIQEFCKQHPLPLTAQEDLHKLINTLFHKEILPSSKYKLDKLFSSNAKIRYYFFCSKCHLSFGELDYKVVRVKKCDACNNENIVYDLTKATFFVIIEFVQQLELLLEDPKVAAALKNPNEFQDNGNIMTDLYDGSVYKKFVNSLDFSRGQLYMSFSASTDGTPVFSTASLSIWPIFVSVNELPPHNRMSNILLAGLWFEKSHPQMDLFLDPFVDYINLLSSEGFSINVAGCVKNYKGFLLGMCVDSGARGSVQCIHTHTGESSCNWCLHPGEVEGEGSNARKFLQFDLKPALRTEDQMIRNGRAVLELPGKDNHINGVLGLSPLLRCPKFHIVDGFILDTLHWASFGVTRRFGKLWLGETNRKKNKDPVEGSVPLPAFYVGTDETKAVINARVNCLRPPREVRRLPKDVSQVHEYNARDWENFALYFSVPLFKNILPERYLKHWLLFVQGLYLLLKAEGSLSEIEVAGTLMEMFVDGVLELYGRKELTFNVHISTHAADNAKRWGNAWSVTAYAFENGNKILKSKIKAERGIPHQVVRSLKRDMSLSVLRAEASNANSDDYRRKIARKEVIKSFYAGSVECMMPKLFSPSQEEKWHCDRKKLDSHSFMECSRIIVNNVCYSAEKASSKTNNSFACCKNGDIVKIRKIIANEMSSEVFLFASKVRCKPYALPALPRNITSIKFSPFMYTVELIEQGTSLISSVDLHTICIYSQINCTFYKENLLSVMANTNNAF